MISLCSSSNIISLPIFLVVSIVILYYIMINSTNSPASGAGNVSEPMFTSQVRQSARSRVRVDQCVSVARAVEVPVLVCLRSSCSHVTEVGGAVRLVRLALMVVVQNDGDFVEVTLL
jgi:hypothetical protein